MDISLGVLVILGAYYASMCGIYTVSGKKEATVFFCITSINVDVVS